ncbi:hypothetical protein L4X63_00335 [Geomonas sp. Red32]|uniref:hypothetical protein n=1 Tax=Geomonas sp. Red32 TaxID=2912856 RepID=UPI00202D07A3|nr:hypothetical protein [Geomonas sp. Red32]MCM0080029.1 hypothetical protein [Geomonas sp. Red32]
MRWLPLLAGLLLSLSLFQATAGADEWRHLRTRHGLAVMGRPVEGARFMELRIETSTGTPSAKLVSYLMGPYIDEADPGMTRKILERSAEAAAWTDLIKTPVLSDRCASARTWVRREANGTVEVEFESRDEWSRGKPAPGCVAIRARGRWVLRPAAGGTRITYTILADPGGSVPVFLVRGMMEDDALNRVRRVVAEAAKL